MHLEEETSIYTYTDEEMDLIIDLRVSYSFSLPFLWLFWQEAWSKEQYSPGKVQEKKLVQVCNPLFLSCTFSEAS